MQKEAMLVNKYGFQEERTFKPVTKRSKEVLPFVLSTYQLTASYNFIQWDPCVSSFRADYSNLMVAVLLHLKGGSAGHLRLILPPDTNFLRSIGCESPKLKLMSHVVITDTFDEAVETVINTKNIDEKLILFDVPDDVQTSWAEVKPGKVDGDIRVLDFSANKLELEVNIKKGDASWLYYADSWHPGWKAFVNNVPTHIARANLAFKAIKLDSGLSKVSFIFDDKFDTVASNFFAILGITFMVIILMSIFLTICGKKINTIFCFEVSANQTR